MGEVEDDVMLALLFTAAVLAAEPVVEKGEYAEGDVWGTFFRRKGELRFCADLAREKNVVTDGSMDLRFTIAPTGATEAVTVTGAKEQGASFVNCVQQRLMKWRFPAARGSASVHLVLAFSADNPSGLTPEQLATGGRTSAEVGRKLSRDAGVP